ncbi:MAG: DUF3466 family protein [Caldilineaceae bacterium]|nr:DUF3466 family protein [Caldilineaceae bacterium]
MSGGQVSAERLHLGVVTLLLLAALLASTGVTRHRPAALAADEQPAPQAASTSKPRYTVADLGTLGGNFSAAYGINEKGQVVGASTSDTNTYAFLWDDGTMTNLGALGGDGSWAYAINDANQVVGGSPPGTGILRNHAFRWQGGSMQDLGTLGGPVSFAFEINNSGQAVGYAHDDDGIQHAVLWGSGGIVDLGDLDPLWPNHSGAYSINDAGQVAGGSYTDIPGQFHAFIWQNGSMQDLGTLGGGLSSAEAINEDGKVVGASRLPDDTTMHAFLWDGSMHDLGILGWGGSIAYDINDNGQVVGALQTGQNAHAFLWENGQMQDLNNLIPADSGWVLSEARAINNKGQIAGFGVINGQTRSFLLKPRAYYWINPSGGSWHVTTNWDPQGDPGDGDTVIFALSGKYTVDASAVVAAAGPTVNFPVGRAIISDTNTVEFVNLALNLLDDSVEEPALTINDGGTVKISSGAGNIIHATVGGKPPANPSNPPIARLQVFNSGTSLNGTGRLSIGDEGPGDLFVANGGQLTSAEARLGGLLSTAPGTAVVGGDGSLWQTGNIAVGYAVSGTLTIENGGRVDSNDAYVSFGILSEDSHVTVEGAGAGTGQASLWALLGSLTVGQTAFGFVEVLNGGDLYVSQDVQIKNGELNIEGRRANGDPSDLDVLGSVFVGGPGSANLLALRNAARGDIEGDLIIGQGGVGAANTANPTQLDIADPQAGLCAIGRQFAGGVSLDEGGLLRCQNIELGGRAGASGSGSLTVDGGMVRALDVLKVGQVGGGTGQIDMQNNALVATNGTYIAPNGVISGTGTLAVGVLGLQNDGTLAPGVNVLYPLALAAALQSAAQAQDTPATLTISSTLTMSPSARLEIPVTGSSPGQYGSLAVTGTVALDGVLALHFRSGYAPRQGETFTFLTATEDINGAFDRVEVSGLPPDFEYDLAVTNGQVTLRALSGAPVGKLFLPQVMD